MCASRDCESDVLVNTKYLFFYICRTILIKKMNQVTSFLIFYKKKLEYYTHS